MIDRREVLLSLTAVAAIPMLVKVPALSERRHILMVGWQSWPLNDSRPEFWMAGNCSYERFEKSIARNCTEQFGNCYIFHYYYDTPSFALIYNGEDHG